MSSLYASGDLLVAPSIYEPFSLAGLEALGAGVPVIAGGAVGLTEIMTSGVHGEVISDPSDIGALSAALRKWIGLMGDPNEAGRVRADCSPGLGVHPRAQSQGNPRRDPRGDRGKEKDEG